MEVFARRDQPWCIEVYHDVDVKRTLGRGDRAAEL